MQLFRDTMDVCGFIDLGFKGNPFTWKKYFRDGQTLWDILDRGLANNKWLLWYGGTTVHHLTCSTLDHFPLFIVLEIVESTNPEKPFCFEEMWLAEKGCSDTVKQEWSKQGSRDIALGIVPKIESCGKALKKWSSKNFGCVRKELKLKQKLLAQFELEALIIGINFWARGLRDEVNDLLDKETTMWFQRSRALWATHGDKNSKYFHSRATQRYKRNKIEGIRNARGPWCLDPKEVAKELLDFYSDLFSSTQACQPNLALETVQRLVIEDMNKDLLVEFTEDEVKQALNQMASLKAPSPDGMPPLFYQHYWELVGKDITTSVLLFLNSATLPEHLNHTFITLIPKVKNPKLVSQFCPISLCNVLYKFFSKVLANRLKKILPHIITEHQSAFTKDHLISDNIRIAFESLHSMQNHKSTKEGYMAIKLNMSKAYDRVEWSFLECMMKNWGLTKSG